MALQGMYSFVWFSAHNSGDYGVVETRTIRIAQASVMAQATLASTNGEGTRRAGIAGFGAATIGAGQTYPDWKKWPVSSYITDCVTVTFGFVSPGYGSVGILANVFVF